SAAAYPTSRSSRSLHREGRGDEVPDPATSQRAGRFGGGWEARRECTSARLTRATLRRSASPHRTGSTTSPHRMTAFGPRGPAIDTTAATLPALRRSPTETWTKRVVPDIVERVDVVVRDLGGCAPEVRNGAGQGICEAPSLVVDLDAVVRSVAF